MTLFQLDGPGADTDSRGLVPSTRSLWDAVTSAISSSRGGEEWSCKRRRSEALARGAENRAPYSVSSAFEGTERRVVLILKLGNGIRGCAVLRSASVSGGSSFKPALMGIGIDSLSAAG